MTQEIKNKLDKKHSKYYEDKFVVSLISGIFFFSVGFYNLIVSALIVLRNYNTMVTEKTSLILSVVLVGCGLFLFALAIRVCFLHLISATALLHGVDLNAEESMNPEPTVSEEV